MLYCFKMITSNYVSTHLPKNVYRSPQHVSETPLNADKHHTSRAIIGGISYLSHCTRSDLTYCIATTVRSIHDTSARHLSLAKSIIRCIKGTANYGLRFIRNHPIIPSSLRAAVDDDWNGCKSICRSATGLI